VAISPFLRHHEPLLERPTESLSAIEENNIDLDMDRQLREFIKEARLELREAAGKLTEDEVAAADRKKRAADFERELGMKLSAMVSVMALDLKVVLVGGSPVARFRCAERHSTAAR